MFNRVAEIAPGKLTTLKANNANYADVLSTPVGKRMEASLGNADRARLIAGLLADPPTTSDDGGASGTLGGTGFDCLPYTEPDTLVAKLDDLDCMVFQTPHSFWLNKSGNETTFGYYPWMGIGDWECSSIFGFDGPVASCLKHDVAYASLQKFTGANPSNIPGGEARGKELDEAWNPRNKSLADIKVLRRCQQAWVRTIGCRLANPDLLAQVRAFVVLLHRRRRSRPPRMARHRGGHRAHRRLQGGC